MSTKAVGQGFQNSMGNFEVLNWNVALETDVARELMTVVDIIYSS